MVKKNRKNNDMKKMTDAIVLMQQELMKATGSKDCIQLDFSEEDINGQQTSS